MLRLQNKIQRSSGITSRATQLAMLIYSQHLMKYPAAYKNLCISEQVSLKSITWPALGLSNYKIKDACET